MPRYINLTPRWTEMLSSILMMYRQAVEGDCTNPDLVKDNMRKELERCAEGADRYGDLLAYLRKEGWNDDRFRQALTIGRELNELERNTVKEG
jgi:hypothetical protein